MTIQDWIPSLTISTLLGILVWLLRNLILTRLKAEVGHEFTCKIEELASRLRLAECQMQEARGAALSALAGRQIALDKRRLEAIEQLWETMGVLGPMRIASRNLTVLTISIALQEAASNPKAREGFNLLAAGANMDGFKGAYKARPFVTPVAWALYSTIYSVCFHIYSCYGSLRTGLGVDLVDHKKMENLITATLGASPLNGVLVERLDYEEVLFKLEEMLLVEFRHMLKGEEGDIMSVGQAQKIITLSMNPLSTQSNSRG